jgi:signal transduction histidine kinase
VFTTRDSGAGPDGSGLTGLRERAEALGGTLKLTSLPGRGTSVDVRHEPVRDTGPLLQA